MGVGVRWDGVGSGWRRGGGGGAGALPPLDVLFYRERRDVSGAEGWRGRRRPWPSRGPRGVAPAVQVPPENRVTGQEDG